MRRREQLKAVGERVRSTRTGRLALQTIVGLIGAIVVIVGIVLIVFPGPGWLIVIVGLAILGIEFRLARRLLEFTGDRLDRWLHWLGRQHWTVRVLAGLIGLVAAAAVVVLALRYGLGIWPAAGRPTGAHEEPR
jgi:uncharacterized protein (TIGR02611 family)